MSDKIKIEADASSYVKEIDKAIRAQVRWDHAQETLEKSMTKLNVKTQAYTTTVKTSTVAGEKMTRVYKTTANTIEKMSTAVSSAAKGQSKMADASKAVQASNTKLKNDLKDLTSEYSRLHAKTREYYKTSSKKIDVKPYQDLHRAYRDLYKTLGKTEAKLKSTKAQFAKAEQSVKSLKDGVNNTDKKVLEFGVSWQGITRLFGTRLTLQAFGAIQQQLVQGISSATEFGVKVAEVLTLAKDGISGLQVAGESNEIAKAFGLDRMDVVEATYQAASNQIVNVGNSMEFMKSAAQLARVGVSSITDSVGILSSVMNAYNMDASDADEISAKLWKTVELGRLRIGDISNDFGRLAKMGSVLGVSFEEVAASLATMTIQGNKASVAQTQLRAVFAALLKPSVDLKKVFEEVGASSGGMLVEVLGYSGALKLLAERTKGNSTELAKLFRNQRSFLGAISNTGSAMEVYERTLAGIIDCTISYSEASKIFAEQDAVKLDLAWNKVKVSAGGFFDTIVTGLGQFEDKVGVLEGISTTLDIMGGKAKEAAQDHTLLTGALGTLIAVATQGQSTSVLWHALGATFNKNLQEGLSSKPLKLPKVIIKEAEASIKEAIRAEKRVLLDSNAEIFKALKEKNKVYAEAYDAAKKVREDGLKELKSDLSAEQSAIKEHKSAIESLQKDIEVSKENIASAQAMEGYKDDASESWDLAKNANIASRAESGQKTLIEKVLKSGDLEKLERALETLEGINEAVRTANEAAGRSTDTEVADQQEILKYKERALVKQQSMLAADEEAAAKRKKQAEDLEYFSKMADEASPKKLAALDSEDKIKEALEKQKTAVTWIDKIQKQIGERYMTMPELVAQVAAAEDAAALQLEQLKNGAHEVMLDRIKEELEKKKLLYKEDSKSFETRASAETTYIGQLRTELGLLQSISAARSSGGGGGGGGGGGSTSATRGTTAVETSNTGWSDQFGNTGTDNGYGSTTINFNGEYSRSDTATIINDTNRMEMRS
jgi:hypothetical protein